MSEAARVGWPEVFEEELAVRAADDSGVLCALRVAGGGAWLRVAGVLEPGVRVGTLKLGSLFAMEPEALAGGARGGVTAWPALYLVWGGAGQPWLVEEVTAGPYLVRWLDARGQEIEASDGALWLDGGEWSVQAPGSAGEIVVLALRRQGR